jgi:hypothetical protein
LTIERFGARNDFDQFLGDLRLTLAVVAHRQLVDHFAGIARGVVHRGHPRALLGGSVFKQRRKICTAYVARQQILENRSRPARSRRSRRDRAALSGLRTLAGMICWAVGTWLITDLNCRVEERATSNSPSSNMSSTLARSSALHSPTLDFAQVDMVDDQVAYSRRRTS